MVTKIVKRDGRTVPFNVEKIAKAIYKAAVSVGGNNYQEAEEIASKVCNFLENRDECPTVEEVQDAVEHTLIEDGHAATAKAYILYRSERTRQREMNSDIMKTYEHLTFQDSKNSDVKRENANVNADTAMGTMLKYGSEGAKKFYQMFVLKKEHADAHAAGEIHIHDLDFLTLTTTCTQIDLIQLFKGGFCTGEGHLREPQSIGAYAALAAIAIQSNQNDQHGGQSVPNFEYAMAIGVRKSYRKLYMKNLQKAIELLTDAENSDDTAKNVISKINEEQKLVPVLEKTISVLKDAKYSKEVAKVLINRLREEKDIIPSLQKTIELLSDLESSEDMARAMMDKIEKQFNVIPTLEDTSGYLAYERAELIEKFGEKIADKIQKFTVKYTEKEISRDTFQAMEGFIHNLNTMHSRAGAQVPFSSINYGLDTTPEGRLVMKQLLLTTEEGLGQGETPIFPIQIVKIKDGINFNEGEPNYDIFKLACRVSAKRLFPNFSFIDAPFNLQYYKPGDYNTEVAYMGCRTRVMANNYDPTREVTCGRGNLSFTSVNLPRIAISAHGDLDKFFEMLSNKIDLIIEQLYERFKIQAKKRVRNYPFLMGQGIWLDSDKLNIDDEVGEILKHGTLSLGFIGLAEALKALIGKHHGESEEAQKLGLRIIGYMRDRMDQACEKTGMNYSLLATPAEGLSGRFIRMDKKKFGIIPGVTDKDYYTNSFHVPVYYKISAFEKIKLEAPYHNLTNAGHISYVELDGDPTKNLEAFEKVIRCMKESGIGYGAINHPVDRDPVCGFTGVIKEDCPHCGRKEFEEEKGGFERIRRITGYLVGTVDRFNDAKKSEEQDRLKHDTQLIEEFE